jgi:hypothetical protein
MRRKLSQVRHISPESTWRFQFEAFAYAVHVHGTELVCMSTGYGYSRRKSNTSMMKW